MTLRFGLIGDGRIACRHKKAIKRIGGKIVSIYDPHPTVDKELNCEYLDNKFFRNLDFVVICSPTEFHYDHLKLVLQHDVEVIVEKPMVLPWQPVIVDQRIFVTLQLRWMDLPKKAEKVSVIAARNDAYFDGWKGDPKKTGGLFFDLFIHYIDLARRTGATFEGLIIPEGEQSRLVDDTDIMSLDMDEAYYRMYRDIVFNGVGVKPEDVAELHWLLGRYTERFGAGRDMINKQIRVKPDKLI